MVVDERQGYLHLGWRIQANALINRGLRVRNSISNEKR
jgi:hypothetical protein